VGADPSKPHATKARDIRRERARLKGKTVLAGQQRDAEKSVEDFVYEAFPETSTHRFEIRTVHAQSEASEAFRQTFDESYAVYAKYQMAVHGDAPSKCSRSTFRSFLCDSSLEEERRPAAHSRSGVKGLGPYHQQYCIDGRIVAVGVIDVLPNCVSSVYLYYDPDYSFLSFGTLSSLFEIALARDLHRSWPELQYYYMGFYIHSCPKMRYKAQYHPSLLLCPEEYTWHDAQSCVPLLDVAKYSRLSQEQRRDPSSDAVRLDEVLVLYNMKVMTFGSFCDVRRKPRSSASRVDAQENNEVTEYAKLVGGPLSRNMLLYRD
jgi:arginine-tRNA-protein transferase